MALQTIWYYTDIPEKVVNLLEEDLSENFEPQMEESKVHGDALNKVKRNSQNTWIPTDHWIGGFIWNYIDRSFFKKSVPSGFLRDCVVNLSSILILLALNISRYDC